MSHTTLFITLSMLIAVGPAAACYGARWWLDRGAIVPPWIFPLLMVAGGGGGLFFAFIGYDQIEQLFSDAWGARINDDSLLANALLVPIAEEIGKAFILLPFALTSLYRGPVDGLIYGFAAGAGFACAENFMYFAQAFEMGGEGAWLVEVLTRAIPSIVIHGGATSAVGAFIGVAFFDRRPIVAVGAPISGFIAALVVHGVWNWLMVAGNSLGDDRFNQAGVIALGVLFIFGALAFLAAVRYEARGMRVGLNVEVAAGRITPIERKAAMDRRFRRASTAWLPAGVDRRRYVGLLITLGLALYRHRNEGRGGHRVNRLRAQLRALRGPPPKV